MWNDTDRASAAHDEAEERQYASNPDAFCARCWELEHDLVEVDRPSWSADYDLCETCADYLLTNWRLK